MSDFQVAFVSVEQKTETTPTCSVDVTFEVFGEHGSASVVQVYATNLAGMNGIGELMDTVAINESSKYTSHLNLAAGTIYSLGLCPRHITSGVLDDQFEGDYWEASCVYQNFATQAPESHSKKPSPLVSIRQARPKTLHDDNRLDISWVVPSWSDGDNSYHAFNVRWYPLGAPQNATQQNVNSGGTNGLWTCTPLHPNTEYAIGVQGEDTAAYIYYSESDWGALTARSGDNHHQLRDFLADSGVDGASGVRRLFAGLTASLRAAMGISLG